MFIIKYKLKFRSPTGISWDLLHKIRKNFIEFYEMKREKGKKKDIVSKGCYEEILSKGLDKYEI
jgi:hypothetical protein